MALGLAEEREKLQWDHIEGSVRFRRKCKNSIGKKPMKQSAQRRKKWIF